MSAAGVVALCKRCLKRIDAASGSDHPTSYRICPMLGLTVIGATLYGKQLGRPVHQVRAGTIWLWRVGGPARGASRLRDQHLSGGGTADCCTAGQGRDVLCRRCRGDFQRGSVLHVAPMTSI